MAALWTLGTVGLYVDGLECNGENILAELDVINATATTVQYYGSKSDRWTVRAHFWGRTNEAALHTYDKSATARTLAGPFSFSVSLVVKSIRTRRVPDKTGEALSAAGEFFVAEIEGIAQ